jgi:hypothetical protein
MSQTATAVNGLAYKARCRGYLRLSKASLAQGSLGLFGRLKVEMHPATDKGREDQTKHPHFGGLHAANVKV